MRHHREMLGFPASVVGVTLMVALVRPGGLAGGSAPIAYGQPCSSELAESGRGAACRHFARRFEFFWIL